MYKLHGYTYTNRWHLSNLLWILCYYNLSLKVKIKKEPYIRLI